eukprot:751776-Hanusia_phi.AAC.4
MNDRVARLRGANRSFAHEPLGLHETLILLQNREQGEKTGEAKSSRKQRNRKPYKQNITNPEACCVRAFASKPDTSGFDMFTVTSSSSGSKQNSNPSFVTFGSRIDDILPPFCSVQIMLSPWASSLLSLGCTAASSLSFPSTQLSFPPRPVLPGPPPSSVSSPPPPFCPFPPPNPNHTPDR